MAWSLVVFAIGLAFWTAFWPKSPGVSIGLLATVAGVMSVRPKMAAIEKFTWVILLIVFVILEVLAINRSDQENKNIRESQNKRFEEIAKDLQTSLELNQKHFDATIERINIVSGKTEEANKTAKNAFNNITGGDSWGWMNFNAPPIGSKVIDLAIVSEGKYPLRDVRLLIFDRSNFGAKMSQCTIGDVPAHYNALATRCTLVLNPSIAVNKFTIDIQAANGSVEENVTINLKNGTREIEVGRGTPDGKGEVLKRLTN